MDSEWPKARIEDISSRIFSGGTPLSRIAAYYEGGTIPWLKTKEVNYRKIFRTEAHITELGLSKSSAKIVPVNSVIVAMYGDGNTAGRVGINKIPLTTNQACCNLQIDPSRADFRFVYFALKNSYQELVDLKNGGGQQNLSAQLIRNFAIPNPPLEIQRQIATILETIDDRIDSLSSSNITLEAIARAIFKAWFVDFDPVRVKAEGGEPEGIDAETAALFPGVFNETEQGTIPLGWSVKSMTDFMFINPPRSLPKDKEAPYLEMANAPTSGPRPSAWTDRRPISGCRFRNGDTLLAKITPCLENGKTAFVDFLEGNAVGWGSTEFVVLEPKHPIPATFGYLLAREEGFRAYAIQSMSGTSGRQRVQIDQLGKFKFAVATDAVYEAFGKIVDPLFAAISHNDDQSKTLAEIRDTLLPRLISGRLQIPEAEKLLEAVL